MKLGDSLFAIVATDEQGVEHLVAAGRELNNTAFMMPLICSEARLVPQMLETAQVIANKTGNYLRLYEFKRVEESAKPITLIIPKGET